MLIETLFSRGIMMMGPSRIDPSRQVGVFNPAVAAELPGLRTSELQKFRWISGEWNHENHVPATRVSPAYIDVGVSKFAFSDQDGWITAVAPDGRLIPQITFDPFSKRWIYVLIRGSYGILRSDVGWAGGQIMFSGLMTMIGIDCEWRMTWTRVSDDEFGFVNEERNESGSWSYIDEWRFRRKS